MMRLNRNKHVFEDISVVGTIASGDGVSVVKPVDIIDELVGLSTETDRLDVQVFKSEVVRVSEKVLRLDGHELRVQPGTEPLSVE